MSKSDALLAIQGNLQATIDSRSLAVRKGLRVGTIESSATTKTEARNDILSAGFSRKLAFTMQDQVYPRQGLTFSPTAIVFSKAPHIIGSQSRGGTQRAKYSEFLAVPIDGGPAEQLKQRKGVSLIDAFFDRFGNNSLQFVNRPGKSPILVARLRQSAAGRYRGVTASKATKTLGARTNLVGLISVPAFTLVRKVTMKKRLRTDQIFNKGARRHPARLAYHLRQELAKSNEKTAIR